MVYYVPHAGLPIRGEKRESFQRPTLKMGSSTQKAAPKVTFNITRQEIDVDVRRMINNNKDDHVFMQKRSSMHVFDTT